MNLTPREVGIYALIKGVPEAAARLSLAENYVKECALNIDEDPFFHKIRQFIIQFTQSSDVSVASKKFYLPPIIIEALLNYDKELAKERLINEAYRRLEKEELAIKKTEILKSDEPIAIIPRKRYSLKPKKPPELPKDNNNAEPPKEKVVNAFDFISSVSTKGKNKDKTKIDSNTKLFMISEVERTKEPTKVANKFKIKEQSLLNWTKQYYQTGNVKSSLTHNNAPSELLLKAIEEMEEEDKMPHMCD